MNSLVRLHVSRKSSNWLFKNPSRIWEGFLIFKRLFYNTIMNQYIIRHACLIDAHSIAIVQIETWKTAYRWLVSEEYLDDMNIVEKTIAWTKKIKLGISIILVVEIDSKIVGFITWEKSRIKDDYDWEIIAFYVLNRFQGMWFWKALFYAILSEFHTRKYNSFYLWVLSTNPTRSFYENLWGIFIDETEKNFGEIQVKLVSYGWKDIKNPSEKSQ